MNLKKLVTEIGDKVVQNRPMITTVAAMGAVALTGFVIFVEAPKIRDILDERKEKLDDVKDISDIEEKKKKTDEVNAKAMKDLAVPVSKIAVGFILSEALIVAINKAHDLKAEVLIAGYEVAKGKVTGYEKILPEVVGEKKAEEIRTKVAAEVANTNAEKRGFSSVVINDDSKCICRDVFGNQWVGTYNDIEEAKNKLNEMMNDISEDGGISLNEFYDYLPNCNRTTLGDDMVFLKERGHIDIRYSTSMDEWTHKPMIIVDYHCAPRCMNKKYAASREEIDDWNRYHL